MSRILVFTALAFTLSALSCGGGPAEQASTEGTGAASSASNTSSGSSASGGQGGSTASSSSGGAGAGGASGACAGLANGPGDHDETIDQGGTARAFRVHVPKS